MARAKNRGLIYARRSTDKQEISLVSQIDWAVAAALQHGVTVEASAADLTHMQAHRLSAFKDIRLDDGISGSDLTRPGFLAVSDDALRDPTISHVFIYKRDRFARPTDAMQGAHIEKKLLLAGITLVFSDAVSLPLRRAAPDVMRDFELLLGYYQGGEELRKHADRVLGFQKRLAEGGFWTGGNAPYGFVRILVDSCGNGIEELPRGKTVKQPGCHVRVVPKDPVKIATWLQILAWKALGWGSKRIAQQLNGLGIPSPDAGRTRTDHGVVHRVSGKWNPNTVAELCRNPIIAGIKEYGKRSEGKIRRLGAEGPRLLDEEKDFSPSGRPRVISNPPTLRTRKDVGQSQCDRTQWEAIQQQMDKRGQIQRAIPRAKDPARYPLSCRLVDLTGGCGSILYGRMTQGRTLYTCGRYMRTAGAECASNQVDAEAILRFALRTLKQLVDRGGNREKLLQKLLQRARAGQDPTAEPRTSEAARLGARRTDLTEQKATIAYRMAREHDDHLYEALAAQYKTVETDLAAVEEAIRRLETSQQWSLDHTPEAQAEAALSLLDDVARITVDPTARAEINPLLQRLGVRVGLNFGNEVLGKKRVVQRLLSGMMVFGDTPLPVPLFGTDHVGDGSADRGCSVSRLAKGNQADTGPSASGYAGATGSDSVEEGQNDKQTAGAGQVPASAAAVGDRSPTWLDNSQPEGISITKGSRGDWI